MKPVVETLGMGQFTRHLATDMKQLGAFRLFAMINNGLYQCNEIHVAKEYIANIEYLLDGVDLGDVKKYQHFYYVPDKKVRQPPPNLKDIADPKAKLEYCFKHNIKLYGGRAANPNNKILENFVITLIDEVKVLNNFTRVQKIINAATLVGMDYQYLYNEMYL